MRVRLTCTANKNGEMPIRGGVAIGECLELPQEGVCFVLIADPIEPDAGTRFIRTTPIVRVAGSTFETQNSTYLLEVFS